MRLAGQLASVMSVGLIAIAAGQSDAGTQQPTLDSLLRAAATYVEAYEQQAAAIVFEESYVQWVTPPDRFSAAERRLRSDVAVVNADAFGWIGFRDVFEVDGKPIRDRGDRLVRLFGQAVTKSVIDRARAIADESARFNLGSVGRNLNYPTMPLMFLRKNHQARSSFSREDSARVGSTVTWIVDFREVQRPTLIGSPLEEVVTSGRFWIEPDTGRVRRSRIAVDVVRATCTYDVEYGTWPSLDVLVPVSMEENVSVRGKDPRTAGDPRPIQTIRGQARYSNFRQFKGTARIKEVAIQP